MWNEALFINTRLVTNTSGNGGTGSHVTVDECQRSWVSIFNFGLFVYDTQGSLITNFNVLGRGLFDVIFIDNYVMYVSDNLGGGILRFDPGITC